MLQSVILLWTHKEIITIHLYSNIKKNKNQYINQKNNTETPQKKSFGAMIFYGTMPKTIY